MRLRCSAAFFAQRIGECRGLAEIGRARALPIHVGYENDIAVAGDKLAALDRRVGHAHPIRRHQQCRALSGDRLVINQRPFGGQRAHGIFDFFDLHVHSLIHFAIVTRPASNAAGIQSNSLAQISAASQSAADFATSQAFCGGEPCAPQVPRNANCHGSKTWVWTR